MLVSINGQSDKSDLILPADVNLRECSVVIIGSRCQICGRDFKCITDVALHMQWRHTQQENVLNGAFNFDNPNDHAVENMAVEMSKCDVCEEHLTVDEHDIGDLKSYKRQINKKRRARKLRLIIKIAGVTMTEIRVSRKYLKVHGNEYFADVGTQTELHENEKRQDDYSTNIDLSFADRVVGNSHVQCVQPHKATNRYIEGKLASIQGDTIACYTRAPMNRPIEMSNMPSEDATIGASHSPSASPVLYPRKIALSSQTHRVNSFVGSSVDTIDVLDFNENWNSLRRNEKERKTAASPAAEDTTSILKDRDYNRWNHPPQDRPAESVVHQQVKFEDRTIATAATTAIPDSCCNKNPRRPDRSSKEGQVASNKSVSKSAEPIEIIIESDDDCDEDITKRSRTFSNRAEKPKRQSTTVVDDDVQEILRITRGKVQNDINHESPNRTEREMLVQNALGQMYVSSTQSEVYPEKDDRILVVNNNNVDSPECPPCMTIVNDDCSFPANVATIMYKTYNDKLGMYFNKLRNYSIGYYNDLPEINNNG